MSGECLACAYLRVMPVASSSRLVRWWPLSLILLLLPMWCVGIFGRGYWAPDEPRAADIAWNMTYQQHKSVPEMAGVAWCETPPLAYWASGLSLSMLGKTPSAARLPNILWAIITVLSVAWLAHGMAGAGAALVAGIAVGTFSLSYQAAIWLASDAPMVAGSCVALLGSFRGVTGMNSRDKLRWYLVMHVGLAVGFMAMGFVSWLVPMCALSGFIIWERRWREVLRWELYVGVLLQACVIGPWILALADQPEGSRFLKIFFYDNVTEGQCSLPGMYLMELPAYLAPWLFLAAAAIRRAWMGCRDISGDLAAWRWITCATVPALLLLSASTTARGLQLAPVMPGFALAIALWAARHLAAPDRLERMCLWATAGLIALAALAVGPGCLLVAGLSGFTLDDQTTIAVVVGGLASGVLGGKVLFQQRRGAAIAALATSVLALNVTVLVAWRGAFPQVDRRQDLTPTIRALVEVTQTHPLLLYQPDETIIAYLDYLADLRPPAVVDAATAKATLLTEPNRLLLVRVDRQEVTPLREVGLREVQVFEIPHGRTYALYGIAP